MGRYVLKTKGGKFVTIRKSKEGWKPCAIEKQNEGEKAPLMYIEKSGNQFAPFFKRGKECFILKVDGKRLKFVKNPSGKKLDNTTVSLRFEKVNVGSGEYYNLQTVTEPRRYISITKTRQSTILLSEIPAESVLITEVAKK